MVAMYRDGKYLTRNVTQCKAVKMAYKEIDPGESDDDSDRDTQTDASTQSDHDTTAPALPAASVPSSCQLRSSN